MQEQNRDAALLTHLEKIRTIDEWREREREGCTPYCGGHIHRIDADVSA